MTDQPRITTASSAEGAATTGHIDKLAIVVVTFKRQELLAKLFDSCCARTRAPWRIIIVDNEHANRTRVMVEDLGRRTDDLWGVVGAAPAAAGGTARVVYAPQEDNLGGAGGFSAGV